MLSKAKTYLTRYYKDKVKVSLGWNDHVLRPCLEAAQEKSLRKEYYWGGFIIDEMKIQVCDNLLRVFLEASKKNS